MRYAVTLWDCGARIGSAECPTVDDCIAFADRDGFGCTSATVRDSVTGTVMRIRFDWPAAEGPVGVCDEALEDDDPVDAPDVRLVTAPDGTVRRRLVLS